MINLIYGCYLWPQKLWLEKYASLNREQRKKVQKKEDEKKNDCF